MDASLVDVSSLMSRPIRVLADLIGLPETLKLLKARGGTAIKIPYHAERANVLRTIVSDEAVKRLCEACGGESLEIPKYDKVAQQLRNAVIRAERCDKSASRLALENNLSRRMVLLISKAQRDDRQVDLFD